MRDEQPDAVQSLVGAEPEHQLQHRRIGGDALPVLDGIDEAGRGHHLEALVDADEELRRNDRTWIAPNCTPSICRGIEPNWLAG